MIKDKDNFERGIVVGLLIAKGSFVKCGKAPRVTIKINVNREGLLTWLAGQIPGSKVYGPFPNRRGGKFLIWSSMGKSLKDDVIPRMLEADLWEHDTDAFHRFWKMVEETSNGCP